jgi:hypothetical protein
MWSRTGAQRMVPLIVRRVSRRMGMLPEKCGRYRGWGGWFPTNREWFSVRDGCGRWRGGRCRSYWRLFAESGDRFATNVVPFGSKCDANAANAVAFADELLCFAPCGDSFTDNGDRYAGRACGARTIGLRSVRMEERTRWMETVSRRLCLRPQPMRGVSQLMNLGCIRVKRRSHRLETVSLAMESRRGLGDSVQFVERSSADALGRQSD